MEQTLSFSMILQGFQTMFGPYQFLSTTFGVVVGLIVGVLPGLGGVVAMVLLIPFTINLDPSAGLGMLIGVFVAGCYGGAITAITLGIPGAPVAAATLLDGYPMAKSVGAPRAIGLAIISSTFGGMFSAVVLIIGAPLLASIALRFGPPEFFALGILGLSTISSIAGESTLKGLMSAALGLLVATVGTDVLTGNLRFTFDNPELFGGITFIATLMGIFAGSEILVQLERWEAIPTVVERLRAKLPSLSSMRKNAKTYIKSSAIGTLIGTVPGTGGVIAAFISYGEAKRSSRNPESFGKGAEEGVIASEAANNAMVGGALVPTLSLGIPGDAASALLIGALMLHGISPGPRLFEAHPDLVSAIFAGFFIANVIMLVIGLLMCPLFTLILRIKKAYLIPVIFLLCVAGTYGIRNSMFDVVLLCLFGVIGYAMRKFGYPLPPLVIGQVLGPMIEQAFRRSLLMSGGNPVIFVTHPVADFIWLLAILFLTFPYLQKIAKTLKGRIR
jgi:putative tricarboxylic transport membrane protein